MNVRDRPGAIVAADGVTESTVPNRWVVNCQLTVPVNVPSRRKMIPVQVPAAGLWTSTSPWLPLPCGRV